MNHLGDLCRNGLGLGERFFLEINRPFHIHRINRKEQGVRGKG
jgi:hypothetical protein